jgi:hypothetical protein
MRWTRRHKSSSLGMFRCIPRICPRRYNHLSLRMPESSPYPSTNMRLSPSYSILRIHMICIVLTCIIISFICLGFIFFNLLGSLFCFYCFFTCTYKLKTTKIVPFVLLLCLVLYSAPSSKALKKALLGDNPCFLLVLFILFESWKLLLL